MMNIVESTNLREERCKSLIIVTAVIDGSCPVVAPFYHGSWFEAIASHLIKIRSLSWFNRWPVTESQ